MLQRPVRRSSRSTAAVVRDALSNPPTTYAVCPTTAAETSLRAMREG